MEHAARVHHSLFRFYGPLNDFLPYQRRQHSIDYSFSGSPGLRDAIQAQGVPHTEVDMVLVDSVPQRFGFHLCGGEQVSVYPRFHSLVIDKDCRLGSEPLKVPRFILDVHLGKLCRHLRLLGFDTAYGNDYEDRYIIDRGLAEQRIILTRDLGILKHGCVAHGYYVRSTDANQQIEEVLQHFKLQQCCQPLSRCIKCNGGLEQVRKSAVLSQIPEGTCRSYELFYQCQNCQQIYWRGAHYVGLMEKLARIEGA